MSHPTVERGVLIPCADYPEFLEFFAHPDDVDELVRDGMVIDGRHSTVSLVGEWPFGQQIRVWKGERNGSLPTRDGRRARA